MPNNSDVAKALLPWRRELKTKRSNWRILMLNIQSGQCGMCAHFGEHHANDATLVQIRTQQKAPETVVEECGHPKHSALHLVVTANSGCDGFEPAKTLQ